MGRINIKKLQEKPNLVYGLLNQNDVIVYRAGSFEECAKERQRLRKAGYSNETELEVLQFIYSFYEQNGYPPTITEIEASMVDMSPARRYLKVLEEKGLITRRPRAARTIVVTDTGARVLKVAGNTA